MYHRARRIGEMGLMLVAASAIIGCNRPRTVIITTDKSINDFTNPGGDGLPVDVDVVIVFKEDYTGDVSKFNAELNPANSSTMLTTESWYRKRPTSNDCIKSDQFCLPSNQIRVFTNDEGDVYGARIDGYFQGGGGEVNLDFIKAQFPDRQSLDTAYVYVIPEFYKGSASNLVRNVKPAGVSFSGIEKATFKILRQGVKLEKTE